MNSGLNNTDDSNEQENDENSIDTSTEPENINKKPSAASTVELLNDSYNLLKSAMDSKKRAARDECDIYGTLVAKKLRRLNEIEREVLMNEIDNILFEKRMTVHQQLINNKQQNI